MKIINPLNVIVMENQLLVIIFLLLAFALLITVRLLNKKKPASRKAIVKKIVPIEGGLFYAEFYWEGSHRYGYLDHLLTREMEMTVRYGGMKDLRLLCRVEGLDRNEVRRWYLTPLEEVMDEKPETKK